MKKEPIDAKKIFTKKTEVVRLKGAKSYIGKKVVDKSNNKIGRVSNILFDSNHKIVSLVVLRNFKKNYLDVSFIEHISKNNILLSIIPVTTNIGKKVFDRDGQLLGKVIDIIRSDTKNNFESLIVRKNLISKKKLIEKKQIDTNKANIILKS